jgi:methionine biosynthesis protein MetW
MTIFSHLVELLNKSSNLSQEYYRDATSLFDLRPGARLLDLGCSDGEFTLKVAEKIGTSDISGIEFMKEEVARAKARGINCYQGNLDGARFPFEDECFDVVCANQVMEHLANTDDFIKEIHRVLKYDGYAVIATPNLAAWHCIFFLLLGWQPYMSDASEELSWAGRPRISITDREEDGEHNGLHHKRSFVLKSLIELARYHGFSVERTVSSGFIPFPSRLARLACAIDKNHGVIIAIKARKILPCKSS